ncbi:uncharacterized protein LOC127148602 [Cucumis melo]|uniref:Uncharacterized protein LOC127148602 n=1 Tax=Cucumis melo TaxID=3656 RepID=A0ABM3KLI5_CUCME|nr:uncharacterized protein LOC127148602 [Cucumis melo]
MKYAKHQEFLNLEQGDMTVEQYDAEFDMLSRFAPDVVKDEEAKTEKFIRVASFKFKGAGTIVLSKVISALRACKLLNQGTWSILASVVDTRESKVSLSFEPVVREYPDVFPDELLGLPPPREIDFAIKYGHYEFIVISFSLTNAHATEVEHEEYLHQVLGTLRANKLDGVSVDPTMIEAITSWPRPSTVSKVHSFLGLTGYYRRFVEGFSSVASPLTQLTRKGLHLFEGQLRIIVAQLNDPYLVEKHRLVEVGQGEDFSISSDDGLTFDKRLCMPKNSAVKTVLLSEAHSSPFTMHPGSMKMYQDLRRVYWWRNMKRKVVDFVSRCLVCQQVKAPRQKPVGLLQPLSVPGSKRESVSMGFMTGLPRTLKGYTVIWVVVDRLTKSTHFILGKSTYTASKWGHYQATIGMAPFEALYGRCCRSPVCWGEIGEQRLLGLELVQTTNAAIQKIRARILTTQSKQKSYVDVRRKDIKFDVGEMVFLKVAPMKVHDAFHIFMLRKYVADPAHIVDFEPLQIDENLSYEEQPVEILAREVKMLRN